MPSFIPWPCYYCQTQEFPILLWHASLLKTPPTANFKQPTHHHLLGAISIYLHVHWLLSASLLVCFPDSVLSQPSFTVSTWHTCCTCLALCTLLAMGSALDYKGGLLHACMQCVGVVTPVVCVPHDTCSLCA